ncbi:TetR/AcrR family transcriptional regulator [Flavitalea sp. BT771]|uniref:TetR/AcrR family transcriptional regulator n=1 Tax=Flavitalea sp. BT771 TaxID=3063329 RepID=UPI0026E2EFDE|nr:TetR/AcrR family transcriptional regulator [Flavitalea sp. BT771]MDO6430128.1 TetR/AcrR family transcriptional regulator [Flavitalea sp. BT771]MDV6219733.1 TetR/AcrR family transcriptional regulator [Flavitalea sp. BT771]
MSTRENIIGLAEDLIRTRGYNAFSYGDISAVLHIRNAAIHYHFPSKTDLGISVVDRELEKIAHSRAECFTLPADQQLRNVVEFFYASGRKGWICLNGSLTPDYLTLPEPLQKKVETMCRTILEWMTECLEKGRKEGCMRFEGAAADRALLVMSALLSSLLLSRVLGREIFDRTVGQLLKDIELKSLNQ